MYTDGEPQDVAPTTRLAGHARKVGHVLFNPAADNVLASSSGDLTVKTWDVESGKAPLSMKHGDMVQALSWSANGSLLVTTCRDKKLRIWDVRQEKPAQEVQGHNGAKNSRVVWMGDHDRVATTGFSKMSDRQLGLWDIRAPREPINGFQILDSISGVCMPFWDDGTQMLYLAGKGSVARFEKYEPILNSSRDGNIRYYEYQNDKFEYLAEYKSAEPQRGVAFLPKRGVNTHENELMRAFKSVDDKLIEPVSFIVPRRAEAFQGDVYPPTVGTKPAMSANEWFAGKEGLPAKISLESLYEGKEAVEVAGDSKPASASRSEAAPTVTPEASTSARFESSKATAEPAPTSRGPTPSVKNNKASIAAMASKFADKEEADESDNETSSSFEEISKPQERLSATASRMEQKTQGPAAKVDPGAATPSHEVDGTSSTPARRTEEKARGAEASSGLAADKAPGATSARAVSAASANVAPIATTQTAATAATTTSERGAAGPSASSAAQGLAGHLQEIKALLQQQATRTEELSREVAGLKNRLVQGGAVGGMSEAEKDERIQQLEIELAAARAFGSP